eukprot:1507418-Ditylum_brightwellii.AAC.1
MCGENILDTDVVNEGTDSSIQYSLYSNFPGFISSAALQLLKAEVIRTYCGIVLPVALIHSSSPVIVSTQVLPDWVLSGCDVALEVFAAVCTSVAVMASSLDVSVKFCRASMLSVGGGGCVFISVSMLNGAYGIKFGVVFPGMIG